MNKLNINKRKPLARHKVTAPESQESKLVRYLNFLPKIELLSDVCHSMHPTYSVEEYKTMQNAWFKYVTNTVANEGIKQGAKKYKNLRSYTMSLMEGKENLQSPPWTAVGRKDRIPSKLNALRPLIKEAIEGSKTAYQAANTLLYSSRILEFHSSGSYDSITKQTTISEDLLSRYRIYIRSRLSKIKYVRPKAYKLDQPLAHSASGPNSKPKIESAFVECLALVQGPLWEPFKNLCSGLGLSYFANYLQSLNRAQGKNLPKGIHLRKLTTVTDADLKMRVVAVSDFWTQTLLQALLPVIKSLLRKLFGKSSGYWSHESGFNKMKVSKLRYLQSYDMTDWSDLFHHSLQKVMMDEIFGNEISDNWFQLVVTCQWYVPELNKYLAYGQGQGMGTTGSFLIATLADHFFLEMIMSEHYGRRFTSGWYNKTGDDLIINDPDLIIVSAYESIGSSINLAKSKGPTPNGSFMEYVSRIAWDSHDVSRVSPNVINRSKDWRYIPLLLHVAGVISLRIPCDGLSTLNHNRRSDERSYRGLLADLLVTLKWTEDSSNFQEFVRMDWDLIRELGYFKEAHLQLENQDLAHNYKIARALIMLEQFNDRANDIASTLFSNMEDLDVHNMFTSNSDCLWNMESEGYKLLTEMDNVIKYNDPEGNIIVAPKSIFAGFLYRRDYDVIHHEVQDIIMNADLTGSVEDINNLNRLLEGVQLTDSFKDFKSFKDTKAMKNAIDLNLRVFKYYDPNTRILKVKNLRTLDSLGINPNDLNFTLIENEPDAQ